MRIGPAVALGEERANGGRRDPEHRNFVALDKIPDAIGIGEIRRAFKEHNRRAKHQSAADRPRSHHPAKIGIPKERVIVMQIEAVRQIVRRLDRKSGMDMQRALGFSGGAGGVNDHIRVIGGGLDCCTGIGRGLHQSGPVVIAPGNPINTLPCSLEHNYRLDRGYRGKGGIGDRFEIDHCTPPEKAIHGEQ